MEIKRYKKNPGDPKCVAFGLYGSSDQNSSVACQDCKKINKKLFNVCIKSGGEFLGTNAETIKPNKEGTKKMDSKVVVNKFDSPATGFNILKGVTEIFQHEDGSKTVVRAGMVVGVLEIAKKLLSEGKSYNVVLGELIRIYIGIHRPPKRSKHNAQSTICNAMQRLGLTKADNEFGYKKI